MYPGGDVMKQSCLALALVLFVIVSPYLLQYHEAHGSARLSPFQTCVWRFTAEKGDRLEGNVTSEELPINVYIYKDMDYQEISEYQSEDSIYDHYGMINRFDFVSNIATDWLIILVNNNNITQETEYYCNGYSSSEDLFGGLAPMVLPMAIVLVVIVIGPIIWYKRQPSR